MLTLRDEQGSRLLTEPDLFDEIRGGLIQPTAEVRYPGEAFVPVSDKPDLARALAAPRAVYARHLRSPPVPWLAIGYAVFSLLTMPFSETVWTTHHIDLIPAIALFGAPTVLDWVLVLLPVAVVAALAERAFGARTLLFGATFGVLAGLSVINVRQLTTLYQLPTIALLSASLFTTVLHSNQLPPLKNTGLGWWNLLAVVPLLFVIDGWRVPSYPMVFSAAIVAAVAAAVRQPSVIKKRPRLDLAALVGLLLLVGNEVLTTVYSIPGSVKTLHSAGLRVWLPNGARVYRPTFTPRWSHWQQRWEISMWGETHTLHLTGSPEEGFTTHVASEHVHLPALLVRLSVWFDRPYDVSTTCAEGDSIYCARAHYLAGDLERALEMVSSMDRTWSERKTMAHELQIRIWDARPDLAPPDQADRTVRWMIDATYGSSSYWELVAPMADTLSAADCIRAQTAIARLGHAEEIVDRLAARCGR